MAAYKTIRYGSKGNDVKTLQKLLNEKGYSLNVDGIYGEKTQSAVKQYQNGNGLAADGIAGKNTWASLAGEKEEENSLVQQYENSRPQYTPSSALIAAQEKLSAHAAQRPGAYENAYEKRLEKLYDEIMSRGEFSYDPAEDPLYKRYKDKYVSGGQLAMQDTMANLASLTGGYGNTYAQAAGQQQMNAYMTALADVLPQMEETAYSRWMDEGEALLDRFGLVQKMEAEDYDRYRDSVDDYYEELEYLYGNYRDTYNAEYESYLDSISAWQKDRAYYYEKAMDELALAEKKSSSGYSSGKSSSAGKNVQPADRVSAVDAAKKIGASLKNITGALKEKYDAWFNGIGGIFEGDTDEDETVQSAGKTTGRGEHLLPEEAWANENADGEYEGLIKPAKKKK